MEQDTNAQGARGSAEADSINLEDAGAELLQTAQASSSGRAARTLVPGAGAPLKQTLLALASGRSLSEHETPTAATLQVLRGVVRLTGGPEHLELGVGDFAPIPPVRHGLDAIDDAVVLITITP